MPDYNLLGSTEVLEELQEGRTRELLLQLQDKPVPEVQDPMNVQTKSGVQTANGDYELEAGGTDSVSQSYDTGANPSSYSKTDVGIVIKPLAAVTSLTFSVSSMISGDVTNIEVFEVNSDDTKGTILATPSAVSSGSSTTVSINVESGQRIGILGDTDNRVRDDPSGSSTYLEITNGWKSGLNSDFAFAFEDISIDYQIKQGNVTDSFTAPTTAPADFKAWNAIRARDVTTGGSTSAEPVEFEILDSTDIALNSTRIPKARIADEPFTMRNRVYSESAGSDGQSDYQITTTGSGGHFGIPILTVVSVKQNGSVLDSANWSFDGTDTVTIDTSNTTIASGDTIDIKYDFDVFDTTLQPRAYLSRESSSETSPSISHFRYEYVI